MKYLGVGILGGCACLAGAYLNVNGQDANSDWLIAIFCMVYLVF